MRLTRSLVGKDPINLDMPEWAFRVLVEVAHLDVADALTVQGVLLNPIFLANSHHFRILYVRRDDESGYTNRHSPYQLRIRVPPTSL